MKKGCITAVAASLLVAAPAMAVSMEEAKTVARNGEIFAGIGVGAFNQDVGNVTGAGFEWGVRAGVNPWRNLGAELNYQGLNTGVSTIVPVGGTPITDKSYHDNQITADAKLQAPMMVADRQLTPYALAGIGYARLSGSNGLNSVGLTDANALAIPLGVGASYSLSDMWAVDGRFTYNILTANNSGPVGGSADMWNLGVNIGARFGSTGGSY